MGLPVTEHDLSFRHFITQFPIQGDEGGQRVTVAPSGLVWNSMI